MSKIIAIANQKGGVGKTTTSVNLAACLAVAEKRTLLIDMDPQANATSGYGAPIDTDSPSIYEVLVEDRPIDDIIKETDVPFLQLAPSSIRLTGAEVEMVSVLSRERRLEEALEAARGKYDYIFIDCPPSLGLLTLNALTAADSVLIPIQCEYYALEGVSKLMNTLKLVQRHLNPKLQIEGVLLTMFDGRLNLSRQVAAEARSHFGDQVYKTMIGRNVKLGEAPSFGKPIILYDIMSVGAQNYISLAGEVLAHG
jgi:chromosome partitioning protein